MHISKYQILFFMKMHFQQKWEVKDFTYINEIVFKIFVVTFRNWKSVCLKKFMGPTWGPAGSWRPQVGLMLPPTFAIWDPIHLCNSHKFLKCKNGKLFFLQVSWYHWAIFRAIWSSISQHQFMIDWQCHSGIANVFIKTNDLWIWTNAFI